VVAEHSPDDKYRFDFDKTEALRNIHACCPHIIREAIKIAKYPHNFSCEDKVKAGFPALGSAFLLSHMTHSHWTAFYTHTLTPTQYLYNGALPSFTSHML
jgi:hypothetical protein